MSSTYSSTWNFNDLTYQRPGGFWGDFYYELFSIRTDISENYTFISESNLRTYGALYSPTFDDELPMRNLLISAFDDSGDQQFRINYRLEAENPYYLVVTTFWPLMTGSYNLLMSGPTSFHFTQIIGK